MSKALSFLPFALAVAAVALVGGSFAPGAWYLTLTKPAWTPPGWLFGPVWTMLYVMIAIAGWRVWRAEGVGLALQIWMLNLALNAAWSWLMFGLHRIDLALIDIVSLLATILAFIWLAWPVDRVAALLFGPYLAWVGFATLLNFAIWRLNP